MNYHQASPHSRKHLFVLTYGRSGSTLLMRLLNTLPGARICGENNNTLYQLFKAVKAAEESRYEQGRPKRPDTSPWFGANAISPERFAEDLVDAFVKNILMPGKNDRIIGFKEIRHNKTMKDIDEYFKFILDYFYNSYIIFNTRNKEEVSESGWWKSGNKEEIKNQLNAMDDVFNEFQKENPDRTIIVNYNEYTNNREILIKLFNFIGEECSGELIDSIFAEKLTH